MNDRDGRSPTAPYGSPTESGPSAAQSPPPAYALGEMERAANEALARFGLVGTVVIEENWAFLRETGREAGTVLGAWASDWPRLDEPTRRTHVQHLVRQIVSKKPPARDLRRTFAFDPRLFGFLFVAATMLGLYLFLAPDDADTRALRSRDTEGREGGSAGPEKLQTGSTKSDTRSSRVCAAALSRVYQGGHVSVADVDGWVVEVGLLKAGGTTPLHTHPALRAFVENPEQTDGSRFIWDQEPALAALDTTDTKISVFSTPVSRGTEVTAAGVTLSFSGTYVDAYFSEENRMKYYHIASALAAQLEATHAALYARCADQRVHSLGSWFWGLDEKAAATALLYFMGTYASPPHLATPFLRPPGETELHRPHAFGSIVQHTAHLDRESLATLVGSEGGMALGKPGDAVVITFPFQDGNRASRVSRSIARVTSLSQ